MTSSISANTKSQYSSSLRQWWDFCTKNNLDTYDVKINNLLDFLSICFESGASYGTLNNHRSAISLISTNNFIGQDERVKRFFKGIFKLKPTFPRYNVTWNPNTVLDFLSTQYPNEAISFEQLSKKLVTLLALASGQRTQTISMIKMPNIRISNDTVIIKITDLVKTSGIGRSQPMIHLPFFTQRKNVCPAHTLKTYIEISAQKRPSDVVQLLITHKRPHRAASSQTIARWIKQTLEESGVDTSVFSAHSTRHASTSAALRSGLSVNIIRKCAGWSDQSAVFANFYNRPIVDCNPNLMSVLHNGC